MFTTFLRHGSVAALLVGAAIEAVAFLLGWIAFSPVLVLLGALMFYLSEYGMHRFAFHAPPLSWPVARKLQHRLHYDHHVEPNRLDLLYPVSGAEPGRGDRPVRVDLRRGGFAFRTVRDDACDPAL
jgi:4-hydroxysphinganine ceramide fatty acyl 2-hydroxylase